MKHESWVRLHAVDTFDGPYPRNYRPWPESIGDLVARYREGPTDDSLVVRGDDADTIQAVSVAFETAHGFKPFCRIVPKYTQGNEEQHQFYNFGIKGRDIDLRIEVNYEGQKDCGNQIPEPLVNAGMGCANGKRQIKDFSLMKPLKRQPADFFLLRAGPRFPSRRVFGISKRVRDALEGRGFSGYEVRPIRDVDGTTESGLYQITISADTAEPYQLMDEVPRSRLCMVCKYESSSRVDMGFGRPDKLSYFSDVDIQVSDVARWRDHVFRVEFNARIVISWRLVKLIREHKFTGWLQASKKYAFEPVLLEDFDGAVCMQ